LKRLLEKEDIVLLVFRVKDYAWRHHSRNGSII
jgi:hypothetical protein